MPTDREALIQSLGGEAKVAAMSHEQRADRYALARRVALDLTGLPPTVAEVDAFIADKQPKAYERFVDLQLAKPSYGEHWARLWLDLARYADSAGYADDPPRTIWAFRDYVINAFNKNLPFNQFTIEQLAADLLENPTDEQLKGTAFHRNTMTNNEGGTNDEEWRNAAIVDRVNTTFAVWMGTSMACGQCHTHKYDPISQKEYYQLFAFLNQTEDADKRDESPLLSFFSDEQKQQRTKWEAELAAVLGHVFTVFAGFKGGKGVATTVGVLLALSPPAFGVFVAVFVATVALTRYISLGSILGSLAFAGTLAWVAPGGFRSPTFGFGAVIALVVILRHHENIGRLLKGEERRFAFKGGSK